MLGPSRRTVLTGVGAATFCLSGDPAQSEAAFAGRRVLAMIEEPGCPYCARWKREVEQSYRNSPEGAFAPLEIRRIGHPDTRGLNRIVYSPTFVFLDNGTEIGRIVGYNGADLFWGEIEILFQKAGFVAR